jgi:hypothetical protein
MFFRNVGLSPKYRPKHRNLHSHHCVNYKLHEILTTGQTCSTLSKQDGGGGNWIGEELEKRENHRENERDLRGKGEVASFVRRFPGFARSSF